MARLHIINLKSERRVEVVLSRRNLLTLPHKLDMPSSFHQIPTNDCWENGVQTPLAVEESDRTDPPPTVLVLRCEDDDEHYAKRAAGPGPMHPSTEQFVAAHGGTPSDTLR
jgi:hypothetical protein